MTDECVYYKEVDDQKIILCLYVDDILIFGTSMNMINDVKSFLSQNFDMKDLGQANVILHTKIIRESKKIIMSQSHYVKQLLKK